MTKKQDSWLPTQAKMIESDSYVQELIDMDPYVNTEDKKGHDTLLSARFPKQVGRVVNMLVEKSGGVYQAKVDLSRDAYYIGLRVIELRIGGNEFEIHRQLAQIKSKAAMKATMYTEITDLIDNLDSLCNYGDAEEAERLLSGYVEAISLLDNGEDYRSEIKKRMIGSLGKLRDKVFQEYIEIEKVGE